MGRGIDKCIDEVVDSFVGNILPSESNQYSSLDNMGRDQLRAALTQLVEEIKEEIRNEANQ